MMSDFDVCIGTGDIPTPDDDVTYQYVNQTYELEDEEEYKKRGLVKDSTGRWYNPNNYIDILYADW